MSDVNKKKKKRKAKNKKKGNQNFPTGAGTSESLEFKVDIAPSGDLLEDKEDCVQSAAVNANVDFEVQNTEVKVEKNYHEGDCHGHGNVISLDQKGSSAEEKEADDIQQNVANTILKSESANEADDVAECSSEGDRIILTEAVGASESLEFKADIAPSGDPLEDKEVCVQSAIVNSNMDCEPKDTEVKVEKNNHEDDCHGHGDVISLDQRVSGVEQKEADDIQQNLANTILKSESANEADDVAECSSEGDRIILTEAVGASESLEFKVDLATSGDPLEDKEVCVQSAIVNSNVDCELKDAEVKVEKNNHEDDCRGHGDVVSLDQRASVVEEKKADDMQLDADDAILESESVNAVVNAAECNSKVDQGSLTEEPVTRECSEVRLQTKAPGKEEEMGQFRSEVTPPQDAVQPNPLQSSKHRFEHRLTDEQRKLLHDVSIPEGKCAVDEWVLVNFTSKEVVEFAETMGWKPALDSESNEIKDCCSIM